MVSSFLPKKSSSRDYKLSAVIRLFLVPAIGGFLYGYDIGGTSFVVLQLSSLPSSLSLSLKNSPIKTGWIVSSPSAGALLGTAILVALENSANHNKQQQQQSSSSNYCKLLWRPMGRRSELRIAGLLYAIGGGLQFASAFLSASPSVGSALFSPSIWVMSLGRWIYGAGIGFAMHGGPTYLAETTPPSIRGMVVAGKELFIVLGILVGYAVGYEWTKSPTEIGDYHNGWAYVFAFTLFVSLPMIAMSYAIPESARYLVSSQNLSSTSFLAGREEERIVSSEVKRSLDYVWKSQTASEEHTKLMEIYHTHREGQDYDSHDSSSEKLRRVSHCCKHSTLSSMWMDRSIRSALRAGVGLVILQQITGQPSVLSYATPILARVPGLAANSSVLLAAFKLIATSLSVLLVESKGRKILLTMGCWMMLASLLLMTVAFSAGSSSSSDPSQASQYSSFLALFGMFAYIAGYQIGFGPITWLMISEVFPQNVRGKAVALSVQINFALNAFVQFLVPVLQSSIGMANTFGIFGLLTAYSIRFIHQYVPETKGLTLEEIEEQLGSLSTTTATSSPTLTGSGGDHRVELGWKKKPHNAFQSYGSNDLTNNGGSVLEVSTTLSTLRSDDDDNEERIQLLDPNGSSV